MTLARPRTTTTTIALAAALCALAAPASAAAQRTARTVWDDVRNAGRDVLFVWSSPGRIDPGDWSGTDVMVGASVLTAVAFTLSLDETVDRWAARDSTSVLHRGLRPLREDFSQEWLGDLGTGRILNPVNGALYVIGFIADNPKLRDAGMGCFATQQASSILRHAVVYRLLPRTRPSTTEGGAFDWRVNGRVWKDTPWEQHSFFGGHVANAAGCAAFFSRRFELGVAEPVLFTLAGGIGVARLVDRRHWLSDQVIGAAIGYAMGKAVADRQLRRRRPAGAGGAELDGAFDPLPHLHRRGAQTRVGWAIRF